MKWDGKMQPPQWRQCLRHIRRRHFFDNRPPCSVHPGNAQLCDITSTFEARRATRTKASLAEGRGGGRHGHDDQTAYVPSPKRPSSCTHRSPPASETGRDPRGEYDDMKLLRRGCRPEGRGDGVCFCAEKEDAKDVDVLVDPTARDPGMARTCCRGSEPRRATSVDRLRSPVLS